MTKKPIEKEKTQIPLFFLTFNLPTYLISPTERFMSRSKKNQILPFFPEVGRRRG